MTVALFCDHACLFAACLTQSGSNVASFSDFLTLLDISNRRTVLRGQISSSGRQAPRSVEPLLVTRMGKYSAAEPCRGLVHELGETPSPSRGRRPEARPVYLDRLPFEANMKLMAKLRAVVDVCKSCDADFRGMWHQKLKQDKAQQRE